MEIDAEPSFAAASFELVDGDVVVLARADSAGGGASVMVTPTPTAPHGAAAVARD